MQTGGPPSCLLHHSLPMPDRTPDQQEAQLAPAWVHEIQGEGCSDSPCVSEPWTPTLLALPVHLQLQEVVLLQPALPWSLPLTLSTCKPQIHGAGSHELVLEQPGKRGWLLRGGND